ncbi:MAG TPA: response regulator transcription factor, partial [Nitrospirales bacterium]|nr:response regulator transcription factor [Nitrospirales bacterium]
LPAIRAIRDACERTKILVLTMHADPSYLRESLSAGCTGYVVKNMADTDLINAIRQVARGRQVIHFSSEESSAFATAYAESRGAAAEGGGRQPDAHLAFTALSPREREVFVFVARGFTNRDIATRLGLSVKSVETYRGRLMEKLGLENRAALVRLALQAGLLTPTEPNDADCRDLPVTDASS